MYGGIFTYAFSSYHRFYAVLSGDCMRQTHACSPKRRLLRHI